MKKIVGDDKLSIVSTYGIYFLISALISYLIGSASFSIIVTKMIGDKTDIRSKGSGNAGFTNVLRTTGKVPAILTFVGDFLKGVIAVWIGREIIISLTGTNDIILLEYISYVSGFFCVIGHLYPCYFGFKGGKGILTAWSIMLLIDWRVFLAVISIFLVVVVITKVISLGSLSAAVSYFPTIFLFTYFTNYKMSKDVNYLIFVSVVSLTLSLIVIIKHRSNIRRLINGTEGKLKIKNKG